MVKDFVGREKTQYYKQVRNLMWLKYIVFECYSPMCLRIGDATFF